MCALRNHFPPLLIISPRDPTRLAIFSIAYGPQSFFRRCRGRVCFASLNVGFKLLYKQVTRLRLPSLQKVWGTETQVPCTVVHLHPSSSDWKPPSPTQMPIQGEAETPHSCLPMVFAACNSTAYIERKWVSLSSGDTENLTATYIRASERSGRERCHTKMRNMRRMVSYAPGVWFQR